MPAIQASLDMRAEQSIKSNQTKIKQVEESQVVITSKISSIEQSQQCMSKQMSDILELVQSLNDARATGDAGAAPAAPQLPAAVPLPAAAASCVVAAPLPLRVAVGQHAGAALPMSAADTVEAKGAEPEPEPEPEPEAGLEAATVSYSQQDAKTL